MALLDVWHLKIFLTLLGGFRVQHVYGKHNQVEKVFSSRSNQNDTSNLEWKKHIIVVSVITKEDFVSNRFGKQVFLLLEVKTCDSIYTKMESQPTQKTAYAHWGKR